MASGDDTGYLHVDVDHDEHRYEEGAHRRVDDVCLVLVVVALLGRASFCRIVPVATTEFIKLTIKFNQQTQRME